MKMKTERQNAKNGPAFKHTCECMRGDVEYLYELPTSSHCVNAKYFEKVNQKWIDVTERVEASEY